MTYQLLVLSRQTGTAQDLAPCATSATYTTKRTGSPGTLQFELAASDKTVFAEGDMVQLAVDGLTVFVGYVFTRSVNRWGEMTVTCYDQLRYLKANASYAFYGVTAADIIRQNRDGKRQRAEQDEPFLERTGRSGTEECIRIP